MASRVPHFSGKSIGRVPREYLAVFLVGVAAALLLVFVFPMQALVAVTIAYLGSIPLRSAGSGISTAPTHSARLRFGRPIGPVCFNSRRRRVHAFKA